MSPLWLSKHQSRLPAAIIVLAELTADLEEASLRDNALKAEVTAIKAFIGGANYKTKVVVMLVGGGPIASDEIDDRLSILRRSATLDGKSLYFLPHGATTVQVDELVGRVMSFLHPTCVEYYRDLSKHARRKRSRSKTPLPTVTPPGGGPQALSATGWTVRYELKLAVLAEFRQELDAASQNYESAYQTLFSSELLEYSYAGPARVTEARSLADIIAFRHIRCHLWNGYSTAAVRTWRTHFQLMGGLLEQPGGSSSIEHIVWQSNWTRSMAELLNRTGLSSAADKLERGLQVLTPFQPADKTITTGERIAPWDHLHHEGYWLVNAYTLMSTANKLSIRDRKQSPEARVDVDDEQRNLISQATDRFTALEQPCMADYLQLRQASDLMHSLDHDDILQGLKELWERPLYRESGWWSLLGSVGATILGYAQELESADVPVNVRWEMMNLAFGEPFGDGLTDAIGTSSPSALELAFDTSQTPSPIGAALAFAAAEICAGELIEAQVVLRSRFGSSRQSFSISELRIVFEGSLKPVRIAGDTAEGGVAEAETGKVEICDVVLYENVAGGISGNKRTSAGSIASLTGQTALTMHTHQVRILRLRLTPTEAGDVRVASITIDIKDHLSTATFITPDAHNADHEWWDCRGQQPVRRRLGRSRNAATLLVTPKAPKLALIIPGLRPQYYTHEDVTLKILVSNQEGESITGTIDSSLTKLSSAADEFNQVPTEQDSVDLAGDPSQLRPRLPQHRIESLGTSEDDTLDLQLHKLGAGSFELVATARYQVLSQPETSIVKTLTSRITVIRPFEANYDFHARLDHKEWPDFFSVPQAGAAGHASGLRQLLSVATKLCSFASEPLFITCMSLVVEETEGGIVCQIVDNEKKDVAQTINPGEFLDSNFELTVQKLRLGDKDPANIDLRVDVMFHRQDSTENISTRLEVPQLFLPMAEPRVLLTNHTRTDHDIIPGLCELVLTIENPSMHYLTFNVGLESSDEFAFSGARASAMSLTPISRHQVPYRILSRRSGAWVQVNFTVVDTYFGKALRVQPASEGVKVDQKGNVFVWISDGVNEQDVE